uniref:Ysc84 actin-binding domain-containing protein n=1 Tax=Lysobacter sp. OC7 TaxID=513005 RepID=C1PHW6_9GAMM|nr:hypothetical protein [Lysobacter sp. OC7]
MPPTPPAISSQRVTQSGTQTVAETLAEQLRSRIVDYYNSMTGSWGLQAGAQSYGYAVFLMNDKAVNYLSESDGWEIGVGPTVVLVNAGMAENLSTSTLKEDAYAFVFDQKGLMAGISIEGTKITKMD